MGFDSTLSILGHQDFMVCSFNELGFRQDTVPHCVILSGAWRSRRIWAQSNQTIPALNTIERALPDAARCSAWQHCCACLHSGLSCQRLTEPHQVLLFRIRKFY